MSVFSLFLLFLFLTLQSLTEAVSTARFPLFIRCTADYSSYVNSQPSKTSAFLLLFFCSLLRNHLSTMTTTEMNPEEAHWVVLVTGPMELGTVRHSGARERSSNI